MHCTCSVAMGRFLVTTQKVDDHWYAADPRARARVDEFLAWQHMGMRQPAMKVSVLSVLPAKQHCAPLFFLHVSL